MRSRIHTGDFCNDQNEIRDNGQAEPRSKCTVMFQFRWSILYCVHSPCEMMNEYDQRTKYVRNDTYDAVLICMSLKSPIICTSLKSLDSNHDTIAL